MRRWGTLLGAAITIVAVLLALVGPAIAPFDPLEQDLLALNGPPGPAHWLGTDHIGRDVFARLVSGARTTLAIAVAGTMGAFLVGAVLGSIALALGRIPERIVFAGIDLVRAMPAVLLALLMIAAMGAGAVPVAIALALSFAPFFALTARAVYRRETAQPYVAAARTFGGGKLHILRLHLAPNLAGALVTQAGIVLPRCIVTESVLSFLGLGSSPDSPTWGRMVSDASPFMEAAPHAILAPVLALVLVTLGFVLLGDALRLRLDPLRRSGSAR